MPGTAWASCGQPVHDRADAVAVALGLQVDQEAAAVERGVGAVHADEGGQAGDIRVLQDLRRPARCWRCAMSSKETVGPASVIAWMKPVSCSGKKPLGIGDIQQRRSAPACPPPPAG